MIEKGAPVAFIKGVFTIFKKTQHGQIVNNVGKIFISVLEYTAFFTIVIFIFDKLLSLGVTDLLNRFLRLSFDWRFCNSKLLIDD